jgi:hypothetical protein
VSGLLTGQTRRGTGNLVGDAFDILIEVFEDIWMGWQDQLDAHKLKYMSVRSRTGVEAESVTVRGMKYNPLELVGLGVGDIKNVNNMPTYLLW